MKLGGPATGIDFLGRDQELSDLWCYLETDHIRFPGVRRLGKTSILQRLEKEAPEHGVLAKWIDISAIHSAQELLACLDGAFPPGTIQHFLSNQAERVTNWFKRIRKVDGRIPEVLGGGGLSLEFDTGNAPPWWPSAEKLHTRLHEQPLLILLDEFPVMLENLLRRNPLEARQVLAWLRIWRQTPGHCRFVFTGSIGLQSLLERHDLAGIMNDAFPYPLGPFRFAEARHLWRHFAPTADTPWLVDDAAIDHALARIGWLSPFFLCLLLDGSRQAARDRRLESQFAPTDPPRIEQEDVDAAYELLLTERSRFHHWEKRLKDALPPTDFDFCSAMLTQLARRGEGLTLNQLSSRLAKREPDAEHRAQRIQYLLVRLNDEGYTSSPDAQKRVQFLSFPLRDWWHRNHV